MQKRTVTDSNRLESDLQRLRHGAASILHNHMGKDLREIPELLRNIRTTVRYTHIGGELTRQTAEAVAGL